MFGVTGSTIDHNAANNSVDGHFMLFDSSANTISNNTAGYPYTMNFLLTDGQDLANDAGYAKLPDAFRQKAIDQLNQITTG